VTTEGKGEEEKGKKKTIGQPRIKMTKDKKEIPAATKAMSLGEEYTCPGDCDRLTVRIGKVGAGHLLVLLSPRAFR